MIIDINDIHLEDLRLPPPLVLDMEELCIVYHNINGLKNSPEKLALLLQTCELSKYPIIGIGETNVLMREGKGWENHHETGYKGFWTDKIKDKTKGSGVAIMVKKT